MEAVKAIASLTEREAHQCWVCEDKIDQVDIANHGSRFLRNDEPLQEVCEGCYVEACIEGMK